MVSLARAAAGLLYRSDGSLSGWTSGGVWASASDPALCVFDPLPPAVLAPQGDGAGSDHEGCRQGLLYVEGGLWWVLYDGLDGISPGTQSLAVSHDRWATHTRLGRTSPGYARVGGGTVSEVATGWVEKRGSTYYRQRVIANGLAGDVGGGVPSGNLYGWDTWSGPSMLGPWTGIREQADDAGTWADSQKLPGSVVLSGGTYYGFAEAVGAGQGVFQVGVTTSSAPDGVFTATGTTAVVSYLTPGMHGRYPENPKVFYHPGLGLWACLANLIYPDLTHTHENVVGLSASVSDWSAATWRITQRVCPMDSARGAIGVATHVTGPEGALVYDAESGIVPFVFDADPVHYAPGWHLGRTVKAAAFEPSASCLRYTSGDATARRLTRTLTHADITIECVIEIRSGSGSLAIEYRADPAGANCYRATFGAGAVATLAKVVSGVASPVGSNPGTLAWGVDGLHRVKVRVLGNAHEVWFDGELQVTYTDSSSPIASGASLNLLGLTIDADVRCLSARTSDVVTVTGLPPGTSCLVRGHGGLPAGSVIADASGTGTFTHSHYPLYSLDLGGTDYAPAVGIWGGDTLAFSGVPAPASATTRVPALGL